MSFWKSRHNRLGDHVHLPSQILDEETGEQSGTGLTVDNQSDPPSNITTLVAPGAVIAAGSAELPPGWTLKDGDEWQLGTDDAWHVRTDGRSFEFFDNEGNRVIQFFAGAQVQFLDADLMQLLKIDIANKVFYVSPGGDNAFAVYDDGSVHIKTGTSIVADL